MTTRLRYRSTTSLWTAACMVAAAGCASVMSEERVGSLVRSTQTVDSRPIGTPRLTLTAHHDGLGWTVSTQTRVERTSEYRQIQHWQGRRYVFSPLSILPGLIQCPVGLVHLFDKNPTSNILRFGCARLAMFEPLDGVTPLPPTSSSWLETKTAWEPLQHAMIQLLWVGSRQHAVAYALSGDGEADVRLSDLLSRLVVAGVPLNVAHEPAIIMRLRYGDGSMIEQPLTISPRQIQQAFRALPGPIRSEQWASPTIVQVRLNPATMLPHEAEFVRDQLVRSTLQRGMCVVVEELHPHLVDEQQVQYSGVVDESKQVRLGKLLSPSVILIVSAHRSGEGARSIRHMAVQIRNVREGQILGTAYGSSRSDVMLHVVERTLTELDLLMANAPRTGCPL